MGETATPYAGPFRTAVHGTVFGGRAAVVARLAPDDRLILVPDAPGVENPFVWVHAPGGDVAGHLPQPLSAQLGASMLAGARYAARVVGVAGPDVRSHERLVVEVWLLDG